MKRPAPNLQAAVTSSYINSLAFLNKLKRYWGTTTVNGELVLKKKLEFYPNMSSNAKKLTQMLGLYDRLSNIEMKHVESAWLYFNPHKNTLSSDPVWVTNKLQSVLSKSITLEVVLGPKYKTLSGDVNDVIKTDVPINHSLGGIDLINAFINTYSTCFDQGFYVKVKKQGNEPISNEEIVIGMLALYRASLSASVVSVTKNYNQIDSYMDFYGGSLYVTRVDPVFIAKVVIPAQTVTSNSNIVTTISSIASSSANNINYSTIKRLLGASTGSDNSAWVYDQSSSNTYLKVAYLDRPDIRAEDRVKSVVNLLDYDYQEESVDMWTQILAIIVVVLISYFTLGTGTAAASTALAAGVGASVAVIIEISVVVSLTAFYITIVAALSAGLGMADLSRAFFKLLKITAPFVNISNIIAIVGTLYTQLLKKGAEVAAKEATEEATEEAVKSSTGELLVKGIKATIKSEVTSATQLTLSDTLKYINIAFKYYKENEIKTEQNKIRRTRQELAKYKKLEEDSRVNNLALSMMLTQFRPLQQDYSYYDSIYEKPYSPWATPYHTGNAQATEVSAIFTDSRNISHTVV